MARIMLSYVASVPLLCVDLRDGSVFMKHMKQLLLIGILLSVSGMQAARIDDWDVLFTNNKWLVDKDKPKTAVLNPTEIDLLRASQDGDVAGVQLALGDGGTVNTQRDGSLVCALRVAKTVEVVQLLLYARANVKASDDRGYTPLHYHKNNPAIVRLLIQHGATVCEAGGEEKEMPIHGCNSCESIDLMVKAGASLHVVDKYQKTVLHKTEVSSAVLEHLIHLGAKVNSRDYAGNTPLHKHAAFSDADAVEVLLNAGADVNARNDIHMTPLHWVGNSEVVTLLLAHKADVMAKDLVGNTPLHRAAGTVYSAKRNTVVTGLKVQGSKTFPVLSDVVYQYPSRGVVAALVQAKASLETRNKAGQMPLHVACSNAVHLPHVISELLASGADVKALDKKKKAALQIVVETVDTSNILAESIDRLRNKELLKSTITKLIKAGALSFDMSGIKTPELKKFVEQELDAHAQLALIKHLIRSCL